MYFSIIGRSLLMLLLWVCGCTLLSSISAMTDIYEELTSTVQTPVSDAALCIGVKESTVTSDALKKLSTDHLATCIALLGKDRLHEQQATDIWNRILEVNGGAPEYIPEYLIRHLGWIAIGIPASHMLNLTMADVDTVSALGVFRNLNESQLSALAQAFKEQWPAKEPEDWTDIDLAMFGHILCGFNDSDILRMHADAYKMAAVEMKLANLRGCNNESMQALAKIAVSADAFGEPQLWEPAHVRAVGCVLSGLPLESLTLIRASSIAGLSADSARCLPSWVTSALTSDQLSNLSPGASGGSQKDVDVPPANPFGGLDDDDIAKNESYSLLSIVCGFTVIFWAAVLWVAHENRNI